MWLLRDGIVKILRESCHEIRTPMLHIQLKQGKSEGFDSCERPSNFTQFGFKSLIFQPVWPWNLMNDLFYITSSFVHHLKPLGEFKLELLPGNAQFGSKSANFCPVWPWNLMDDPEKIIGHLFYATLSFVYHFEAIGEFGLELQSGNVRFGSKSANFCPEWPWNLMHDLEKQ